MATKAVDIIMWAGEDNYSVSQFIEEANRMGVSKRIPITSIPEGIIPNVSRLFIKHRKAITKSPKYIALVTELQLLGVYELYAVRADDMEDLYGDNLLVTMALEKLREEQYPKWKRLVEVYEVTWEAGVIGYTYITNLQYVVHDHEEGLPEEIEHLEDYIEPVRIEYADNS